MGIDPVKENRMNGLAGKITEGHYFNNNAATGNFNWRWSCKISSVASGRYY